MIDLLLFCIRSTEFQWFNLGIRFTSFLQLCRNKKTLSVESSGTRIEPLLSNKFASIFLEGRIKEDQDSKEQGTYKQVAVEEQVDVGHHIQSTTLR